jgi:hypothetical protein
MAVDQTDVRANYMRQLMILAAEVQKIALNIDNLANLYTGSGLSGTFVAGDMINQFKHMDPAAVGTYTTNLQTVRAAITTAIEQNMAACAGQSVALIS